MVVQANTVQSMYVDNRNYPGGPWTYFLATQNLAVDVLFYATLFVLTFLSDMLVVSDPSTFCSGHSESFQHQLWRCWVIWNASGRVAAYSVTLFPALLLLASFGKFFFILGLNWTYH